MSAPVMLLSTMSLLVMYDAAVAVPPSAMNSAAKAIALRPR